MPDEIFFYLTTTGRHSGQPHKIEIWFVPHDDCYCLCAEKRDAADWVQNIQNAPAVTYAIGTRMTDHPPMEPGTATFPNDPPLLAAVKAKLAAKYNWSNGLLVQVCPV